MGCPESVNNQTIKFAEIVGRITHARARAFVRVDIGQKEKNEKKREKEKKGGKRRDKISVVTQVQFYPLNHSNSNAV